MRALLLVLTAVSGFVHQAAVFKRSAPTRRAENGDVDQRGATGRFSTFAPDANELTAEEFKAELRENFEAFRTESRRSRRGNVYQAADSYFAAMEQRAADEAAS